ncbi:MAG TPA: SelB C-terminal domain-containing protein, partial [Chthonomonadales bacterium]|nr:SelB C-terminal domain-containing protein [Chthonomonadales bacterium]
GVQKGLFERVQDGLYLHSSTASRLKELAAGYIATHGSITVSAFRDLTHSNRKYSLLVLEHFDALRFTRRTGDERVLV